MVRYLFHDVPLTSEYAVWFDDDSFVEAGWWEALLPLLQRRVDYIGQEWWVDYLPGQKEMIQAQPWYRGVHFEVRNGKPGVHFMTGGFLAVRSACLAEANFPEPARWKGRGLLQYGGDTLLCEVARQFGRIAETIRLQFPWSGLRRPLLAEMRPADLLDRMASLNCQLRRISEATKPVPMLAELGALRATRARVMRETPELSALEQEMWVLHEQVATIEEEIAECERRQVFGERFIELARAGRRYGKERERVKRRINTMFALFHVQ